MPAFRRVADDQAGAAALGLLLPPGRRTVVVVRPRALPWGLLVVQSSRRAGPTTAFRDFGWEEALAATEGLALALEQWADGGPGRVEAGTAPGGAGFLVRAEVGIFPLLACPRRPGQPYKPLLLPAASEADGAAAALAAVLCPAADAGQELYFNLRHFGR